MRPGSVPVLSVRAMASSGARASSMALRRAWLRSWVNGASWARGGIFGPRPAAQLIVGVTVAAVAWGAVQPGVFGPVRVTRGCVEAADRPGAGAFMGVEPLPAGRVDPGIQVLAVQHADPAVDRALHGGVTGLGVLVGLLAHWSVMPSRRSPASNAASASPAAVR